MLEDRKCTMLIETRQYDEKLTHSKIGKKKKNVYHKVCKPAQHKADHCEIVCTHPTEKFLQLHCMYSERQ